MLITRVGMDSRGEIDVGSTKSRYALTFIADVGSRIRSAHRDRVHLDDPAVTRRGGRPRQCSPRNEVTLCVREAEGRSEIAPGRGKYQMKNHRSDDNRDAVSGWEDDGGARSDAGRRIHYAPAAGDKRQSQHEQVDASHQSDTRGEHRYDDVHQTAAEQETRAARTTFNSGFEPA